MAPLSASLQNQVKGVDPYPPFPNRSRLLVLILSILIAITFASGCGGKSDPKTPVLTGDTQVVLQLTSTGSTRLSEFKIGFSSISLTSQSGKVVTIFSDPQGHYREFAHVNGSAEPLATVSVPQDVYTAANISLSRAIFECVDLTPTGGLVDSYFEYPVSVAKTTVSSPMTISGKAMALLLDLQVSDSATLSNCGSGASFSIAPAFKLTPITIASQPTNLQNGKSSAVVGQISSIDTLRNSFGIALPNGQELQVASSESMAYQNPSGFSGLALGTFVNTDLITRTDGSLVATRVSNIDSSAANAAIGPVMYVSGVQPFLVSLARLKQGRDVMSIPGALYSNFSNATFQVSGLFTNPQQLPFNPTFDSQNIVPGQNVSISVQSIASSGGYPYTPATTITLMPQTINGTVTEMAGNPQVLRVALAPYDLFRALSVQPGQTTRLLDPRTVMVYTSSSTQVLASRAISVGSVLRFQGFVFNDNGTLRMDCAQVSDGVTE